MSNNELNELLKNSHKDLSVEDFEGKQVPCIGFEGQKFDDMLSDGFRMGSIALISRFMSDRTDFLSLINNHSFF